MIESLDSDQSGHRSQLYPRATSHSKCQCVADLGVAMRTSQLEAYTIMEMVGEERRKSSARIYIISFTGGCKFLKPQSIGFAVAGSIQTMHLFTPMFYPRSTATAPSHLDQSVIHPLYCQEKLW